MRKISLLLLLVPFIALSFYGCGDNPVDPQTANVSSLQDAATPYFAKNKREKVLEVTLVTGDAVTVPVGQAGSAAAVCPEGSSATGGGVQYAGNAIDVQVAYNRPRLQALGPRAGEVDAWEIRVKNQAQVGDLIVIPSVVCLKLEL